MGPVKFEKVSLADVEDWLENQWSVPLSVDDQSATYDGPQGNELVSLDLANPTLAETMTALCTSPVFHGNAAYWQDDRGLEIGLERYRKSASTPVVIYNVRDLIPPPRPDTQSRQEVVDQLTRLVKTSVEPGSWKDNGGSIGSLGMMYGNLVVTQSWPNQEKVKALLQSLREHGMTTATWQNPTSRPASNPSQ